MKLVVCIIHNRDKNRVTDKLIEAGFKFTVRDNGLIHSICNGNEFRE